jgi:hypothetical protein
MDDIFHAKIIGDAEMQALSFILVFIDLLSKIAGDMLSLFSAFNTKVKKSDFYTVRTLHFFLAGTMLLMRISTPRIGSCYLQ